MTPETAHQLLEFILPQYEQESATTRKLLAAVPADHADYKPSETCMTGLQLAGHIALSDVFFLTGIRDGAFAWKQIDFATPAEALAYFDANVPALLADVAKMPAEKLAETASFGPFSEPMIGYFNLSLKHTIHHRGQLSAYLRPMGAKVPSIYGPSADEPMHEAAHE